ncbi:MAG: hypothetical protein CL512_03865 [Actinobacteria bacterium]|nr:hypothetical protein [Actinomycetota bacterium]|tara:strand:+ start:84 stop:737 length:654 start_codon:yes stop_codon:yes gene_type:complete
MNGKTGATYTDYIKTFKPNPNGKDRRVFTETGCWNCSNEDMIKSERPQDKDPLLAKAVLEFIKRNRGNSLYDLGCGATGDYVKYFLSNGLNAVGVEGNPHIRSEQSEFLIEGDLTKELNLKPKDWTLSLEVGEHIPADLTEIYLDNVVNSNKQGVIISWAIPGQGGFGHFNERPNEYVKKMFKDRGLVSDEQAQEELRKNVTEKFRWFKKSIMVFRK